nr:ARID DNA-binding domain-containing protein [Tanacetum cinerariifolium]
MGDHQERHHISNSCRQIKKEKEDRLGRCVRQITKDGKNMLKKKIEEIEVYNSSLSQDKYKQYNCFYCNQKGHVVKACPTKIKDEASYPQGQTVGFEEGSRDMNNITQAKINKNKDMVMCFKCQKHGHFANRCPTKEAGKPKVSIKYPEFIHFKTKGIIKRTDNGEVLIMNGNKDYLISGVHYAPEVTLNILSINQLKQEGFEIIYEGNRCTLEYMFKNQHGRNLDVDKIRQRHNDYFDDYFESLDKERTDKEGEEPRIVENTDTSEVHTFQEYVAFMNLIKDDDDTSKEGDTYRNRFDKVLKWFYNHYLKRPLPGTIPPIIQGVPIHLFDLYKLMDCMGGYLNVQFGQQFDALAEILGLTRSDGEEIRKRCIICCGKGKEKLEHFGIKLKEEEDCKQQQPAYQEKEETQIECYKCQDLGHYVFKYPNKNEKYQDRFTSYKGASTSKPTNNKDTQSTSSDDFRVIT